jgi:nicotinamidase-related amidase
MLISSQRSVLLVSDLQQKLLPVIHDHEALVRNVAWLVRAARRIGVPVIAVEQYPKGLGRLAPEIAELVPASSIGRKMHFSCVAARCLDELPGAERPQVVIAGIEAHVCVLQTALELAEDGKEVYVVGDSVESRRPRDRDLALERMRHDGVRIVSREMAVFEWLGEAGTPLFRDVSREFLKP